MCPALRRHAHQAPSRPSYRARLNDGDTVELPCVASEELGREVVRALDDHVDAVQQVWCGLGEKAAAHALAAEALRCEVGLGAADVLRPEERLPMEVGGVDHVVVDEAQRDPRRREDARGGTAQAADSDEERSGRGGHQIEYT